MATRDPGPNMEGRGYVPARRIMNGDDQPRPSRRKPHRLPAEEYRRLWQPVIFTTCTHDRRAVLTRTELVEAIPGLLDRNATANGCAVITYCILPDHLHVLACVAQPHGDVRAFFEGFKCGAANLALGLGIPVLWQRNYWDRHTRDSDDLWERIRYILDNPVRRGLCERAEDWPYAELRGLPWEDGNGGAGT